MSPNINTVRRLYKCSEEREHGLQSMMISHSEGNRGPLFVVGCDVYIQKVLKIGFVNSLDEVKFFLLKPKSQARYGSSLTTTKVGLTLTSISQVQGLVDPSNTCDISMR